MSHQRGLCKCPGCPDRDTAACPYRQSENQVKELLVERKFLRETWEKNARQNAVESPGTASNSGSPKSLCPSCKNRDVCDARTFVVSVIDDCTQYERAQ